MSSRTNTINVYTTIKTKHRIKISSGNFSETSIYPIWSAPSFQGRGSVVIEGNGSDNTHIYKNATGAAYLIYIEAARTVSDSNNPIEFKNLDIYNPQDRGASHDAQVIYNVDSGIITKNCKIGDLSNDDSSLIAFGSASSSWKSVNSKLIHSATYTAFQSFFTTSGVSQNVQLINSIFINGEALGFLRVGGTIKIINCVLYNIRVGISIGALVAVQPEIKNCIIFPSGNNVSILNNSALTFDNVDYNLYKNSNTNTADGGHSLAIGTDPKFKDAVNYDFRILTSSPCKKTGVQLSDVIYDFNLRKRRVPPCIGAYEVI